jgi:hypothetical protein
MSKKTTWTYYKGAWHEGDVRILGAASHATWLGLKASPPISTATAHASTIPPGRLASIPR